MQTVQKATAAPATGDPLDYVMSDATVDRYGDIIEPKGWELQNFKKNPIALFGHDSKFIVGNWRNIRVEGGKLLGKLELLQAGVSERLDEIRAAVEAGVLRAVSVGFHPIQSEPIERSAKGGVRFLKSELVECSLVSVPANPNALAVAKSLHLSPEAQSLIFGESAEKDRGLVRRGSSGESAANHLNSRTKKMSLSQKIEAAQTRLNELRDQQTELVSKSDGDEMAEADLATIEEVSERITGQERTLAALKVAEKNLAISSEPAVTGTAMAVSGRRPFAVAKKETKPGDLIIRAAAVHAIAHATGKTPETVLSARYGDDEQTGMVVKAAVSGATTTGVGWAAELVNTAMTDFLESLRAYSVYPALTARSGGRLAFGPNQGAIKIPSRAPTPSIGGSFVGEGAPIPVRRLGLTSITLTPKKMAVISVFSREIGRYSTPAIETLIRQEIEADTAITLDSLLLDAVAASSVRPAGLLNGVTVIAATAGGGQAAILGDIRKLRAPFDSANAGRNLVMLVNPAQAEAFNLVPDAGGGLGWAAGVVSRYGAIASTAIPVGRVIMVDAADFVTATGDVPEFEVSNSATLHMEDTTPAQLGTAGTPNAVAAPVQSMFQTDQIAIRMTLDVSWAMRRAGMVSFIDAATW